MSNKAEERELLPKLRFPEFRDSGKWMPKTIGSVCKTYSGGTPATVQKEFYGGDIPFIRSAEIGKENTELFLTPEGLSNSAAKLVAKGDVLVALYGANSGDVALARIDGAINQAILCLKSEDSNAFIYQYLSHIKNWIISTYIQGGQGNLSGEIVKAIELCFSTPDEQQKVADCLASIDERITLEAKKLDTLKTHKNGLMQQLFPAEDETLPKLRFPEFREAGEWEEKRLGDVGNVRMCKRILKEQTSPRGDIPFYKIGTFGGVPDAYISKEIFENFRNSYPFPKYGAVLISAAGTIGRTVRYNGELAYFQDSNIVWLDNSEKLIADNFLFYLYQLIDWSPSVGAIQRLYNENILGAQVKFSSIPEQQKIAGCLASLDDLITAQTQKLTALKTHKKGLMQQLFPALDEVPV